MEKPNFLVIITDQQRADTLSAYGSALQATPHIDGLAQSGVTFARAYCNNPLCMPSRAAMLTGRYPSCTGVRTNGCIARPDQPLLPALMGDAGYQTAAFGKIHYHPVGGEPTAYWPENHQVIDSGVDLQQPYLGFQTTALACGHQDVVPGLHARELAERCPEIYARRGPAGALQAPDEALRQARKIQTYKTAIPEAHYPTTWVADRTIEYLEHVDQPFFLWCGFNDPHHPFKAPGRYWDRFSPAEMPPPRRRDGELDDKPPHFRGFFEGQYEGVDTDGFLLGSDPWLSDERVGMIRAAYYGMVAMIDDQVGRILGALERNRLRQNTIVLFASDHGEYLGDHGFMLKGPMHYESLLRVPLVWQWPERFAAARRIDGLVSLIDIFPTILELADAGVPAGTQGRSLVPQLQGETGRGWDDVYIENDVDHLDLRLRTLVTERWKLTWYAGADYGEIYDLEEDPGEFVNLWDRCDATLKHDLTARLLDTMAVNQDTLPPKRCHA